MYWDAAPVVANRGRPARDPRAAAPDRRPGRRAHQLPDRKGADHAAARDGRHLQPDRGAADRLRPHVRPPHRPALGVQARPSRHPPHGGQRNPAGRLRLPRARRVPLGRFGDRRPDRTASSTPIEDHPLVSERGGLVVVPAAAGLPRLLRPTGIRRAGVGADRPGRSASRYRAAATRSARCGPPIPGRCSETATAGGAIRSIDDGHYITTGAAARLRHPERARTCRAPGGSSRRASSTRAAATWRPCSCRPLVRPEPPLGTALRVRPGVPRRPALLADHAVAAGERPASGRRLGRRRPAAGAAPGLARRARPAAGIRLPRLQLRADRLQRSGAARALRPGGQRAGRSPHQARSQPGLPDSRPGEQDGTLHRHRGSGSGAARPTRARAGSPATAPARCR